MSKDIIKYLLNGTSSEYFKKENFEGYEWIGKPNFMLKNRDFSVLKKERKYYLDLWNEFISEEYLIEIEPDISLSNFIKLVNRYVNEKIAPEVDEVGMLVLYRLKMNIHKNYESPVCVEDDKYGWHNKIMAYGKINDVANFENSLLLNSAFCKTILRQMTAFYNDGEPITSIETRFSSSIVEFILRPTDDIMFVIFYYKGTDSEDIPVDVKKCIDDYGLYQIE